MKKRQLSESQKQLQVVQSQNSIGHCSYGNHYVADRGIQPSQVPSLQSGLRSMGSNGYLSVSPDCARSGFNNTQPLNGANTNRDTSPVLNQYQVIQNNNYLQMGGTPKAMMFNNFFTAEAGEAGKQ